MVFDGPHLELALPNLSRCCRKAVMMSQEMPIETLSALRRVLWCKRPSSTKRQKAKFLLASYSTIVDINVQAKKWLCSCSGYVVASVVCLEEEYFSSLVLKNSSVWHLLKKQETPEPRGWKPASRMAAELRHV